MEPLIKKAQKGDTQAFEELVKKYDSRVLSIAYQIAGNQQDAEDIYQETFIKVFRGIDSFRSDSSFYTWLYRIAVNCSLSYCKKKKRNTHVPLDNGENDFFWKAVDSGLGPEGQITNKELRRKIEEGVDKLPPMQKAVFVLKYFHGQKIKEISWITDCAEGTVKNYLFRARETVKQDISSYIRN